MTPAEVTPAEATPGDATAAGAARIFDPGMQPERTALAWRRTGLAMVVGSLAALRLLPGIVGPLAFVAAGLAFALAVTVLIAAQVRYRRHHTMLTAEPDGAARAAAKPALSGGILITITAGATLGLAICAALVFAPR